MTKRKKDLTKPDDSQKEETKTSMPPERSGATVDLQSKSDWEAGHFPIVGIWASAGGLAAFEAFYSGMPADADPGMTFVLVQQLAPDHKSILTDLIQRYTWVHNPNLVFTAEQIIGKVDGDFLPEQEATTLTAIKQQVLESSKGTQKNVQITVAGKTVVYNLTVEPLHDDAGKVVGITNAILDFTGQQRR